jgi:hypothetical protein
MKRIVRWLWLALAIAVAQLGWTWLQRRNANFRMEDRLRATLPREQPEPAPEPGHGVQILQFYARSGEMVEGEPNVVCYGVRNAKSVRLEPPVENVYPALVRCFGIEPQQDTTYQLTAEGIDGSRSQVSFHVRVRPAPPVFRLMAVSAREIPAGEAVTVCYGVEHASAVRLDPTGWELPASAKNCIRFYPKVTTGFTLSATGQAGMQARERFRVRVR